MAVPPAARSASIGIQAGAPGAADRLVRGEVDRLQAGEVADRSQRDHAAAVVQFGLATQVAGALADGMAVRLRHDQRHLRVEAEGARVVHDQRHRPSGALDDRARGGAIGGQEQDVQLGCRVLVERRGGHRSIAVADGRRLGTEGAQRGGGQARIGQDGEEDAADHAAGARHADGWPVAHEAIRGAKRIGRSPANRRPRSA